MLENLFSKQFLVRRMTMIWMMVMTTIIIKWVISFATTSPRSGTEIAMILGAILTPWATLQGFVFKFYNEARNSISKQE